LPPSRFIAYVGTFSSPLHDVLPSQVDLPPATVAVSISFKLDRVTGAMTPLSILEMGTSPSCLAVNAAGTRLYSSNETIEWATKKKARPVHSRSIGGRKTETSHTIRSGGAGPRTSRAPKRTVPASGQTIFGGSLAVLPILADGRLGEPSDIETDSGKIGPASQPAVHRQLRI